MCCQIAVHVFTPHGLQHLELVAEEESTAPITDILVDELVGEGAGQIYAACGRGRRSSLRIMRHGLAVTDVAEAPIPGVPSDIFTVKTSPENAFDSYIVVSFANATIVLQIGEGVEEVVDSGFHTGAPTIAAGMLADGSIVQVHNTGMRHILADRRNQWVSPNKSTITRACVNSRQIVVALAGGLIIAFEQDDTGNLEELEKFEVGAEVRKPSIASVDV